jgi:pyruvate,water dikinase
MSQQNDWTAPIPGLYGSSFRLGEWISGPVTPLFEDWALTRLEAAMHATHKGWSGQPAPLPHHVVVNGWYFYSLAWLPVTPRALLRWAPSLTWHLLRHPRRMAPILPPTTKYGIGIWEREWRDEAQPRYLAETAAAARRVEEEEPTDLPRLIDDLLELAGEYFAWVTVVGGAAYKAEVQLVGFYHKQLAPRIGGTHLTLLIGLDSPTVAPPHAVATLDWASPTLGERGISASAPAADIGAKLREQREDAEYQARAALSGSARQLRKFDELLALAQHLAPIREEQMAEFTLPWPVMRRALERIAESLVDRGTTAETSDVYYLRRAELVTALGGDVADDVQPLVSARRTAVGEATALTPPRFVGDVPRLLTKLLDMSATQMGVASSDEDGLVGIPVSPGSATGPARIVRDPGGFDQLLPGDVLVAPTTAPAWTPLFARASAVVTDGGNVFSHASVVAREFGIPAVAGCVDATRRLKDGQTVTVDGSNGTVVSS